MKKTGRNDPCPCGSGKKFKKCHGDASGISPPIVAALKAYFEESQKIEGQTFETIGSGLGELVGELRSFDPISCVTAIAALQSIAENRNSIVRLDALFHLVAIHCHGARPADVRSLDRWLNRFLAASLLSHREDPAEDVAIGNVMTTSGNYRVFNGDSSHPDYYAQDVLDALARGPEALEPVRIQCRSLLKISDLLASRRGYPRWTGKPESESKDVWLPETDGELGTLSRSSLLHTDDLAELEIAPESLDAFSIPFEDFCTSARLSVPGAIRRKPLLALGDSWIIAHPTAVPMAVIAHTFSSVKALDMLPGLENGLGGLQAARTLHESARGIARADFLTRLLPESGFPPARYVSQVAFRFDRDKYLHLLFLHDDVYDIEAKGANARWEPAFRETITEFIENSTRKLLDDGNCIGGLTLVIIGGVWRGCVIELPQSLPSGCGLQAWSSADFDRLMANERRWRLLLWKLSMQRRALEELGIAIQPISDANLFSMWTHNDYRFFPRDSGTDSPNYVSYGAEFIFEMRVENRIGIDDHCIYRPDRARWERVRKLNSRSYFKEDAARKTYGALSGRRPGVLEGAVETTIRAWWVDCHTTNPDPVRKDLIYQLWETVVNWLDRIASSFDDCIPELRDIHPVLTLDVSEIEQIGDFSRETVMAAAPVASLAFEVTGTVATLRLPVGLLAMEYSPANQAERILVNALVRIALAIAGVGEDQARIEVIEASLDLSNDDRFMHLFPARDVRDFLHGFDPESPELLHNDEVAFGAIQIAQEASLSAPLKTDSIDSSNELLHRLVDAFWKRIEIRLRAIDRHDLISACMTNHERLLSELERWQKTSRAVLSLHKDREDILKVSQTLKEKRDRTQITHRILIEMAVCTCPLAGGRLVTQADLDYLGSQILLLIATAAHSDAIRARCADPRVGVSTLGDFSFQDNFMGVMVPYMTSHFERSHLSDVRRYDDLFEPEANTPTPEEEIFGKEFVEGFLQEFGISPARLAEVGVRLGEDAVEFQATVITRDAASFNDVLARGGFTQSEIEALRRSFVLRPRDRWDAAQKPFKDKDWFPWRFRRRLSLMARPIVDLEDGRILYAPGFCEDSFRHTVMECFHGAFETEYFLTSGMKEFCGSVNGRRGLEFNRAIGTIFAEAGWKMRTEVAMTELGAPAEAGLGDVDVLAWNGHTACICECKELLFARTIGEVTAQLVRFRGKPGDDLDKHIQRVRFLKGHRGELSTLTGIDDLLIVPLLVTSKVVPMQFVANLGAEVVSADQITSDYLNQLLERA